MNTLEKPLVGVGGSVRRRWRPRFSLRTLVLFVLTIASGAVLWWNWGPWGPEITLRETGQIYSANLLRDGSGVVLLVRLKDENGKISSVVKFRELPRGATRYAIEIPDATGMLFLSEGEKHMHYCVRTPTGKNWPVTNFWRIADGSAIDPNAFIPLNGDITVRFSEDDRFAYARSDFTEQRTLLKMPEMVPIGKLGEIYRDDKRPKLFAPWGFFSPQGRWFVDFRGTMGVSIYDLAADGKAQDLDLGWSTDGMNMGWVGFSPDERWFGFCRWKETPAHNYVGKTHLFDTGTWSQRVVYDSPVPNQQTPFSEDSRFINIGYPYPVSVKIGDDSKMARQAGGAQPGYFQWTQNALVTGLTTLTATDRESGRKLWELELRDERWMNCNERGSEYGMLDDPDKQELKRIFSYKTGQVVLNADDLRWRLQFGKIGSGPRVIGTPGRFLTSTDRRSAGPQNHVVVWHQTRREEWWGFFCLAEFWITVLCAGGLAWSVFSGSKRA